MMHYLISAKPSKILQSCMTHLSQLADYQLLTDLSNLSLRAGDVLVIAADLDELGENRAISAQIQAFISGKEKAFSGVKCGLCLASDSIYHTKDYAKRMAFVLNRHGAQFNGQSLFELVKDYQNLLTWQKHYQLPLREVCQMRLTAFHDSISLDTAEKRKKIVALHASERKKSNTLTLWEMVAAQIERPFEVSTIHIENGEIVDCKGCDFNTCLHFAKQHSCYYGGQVTRELLPAIAAADIVVWICPNYNDAVSAMHTALINRLTVLYRRMSLSDKQIYGIVVSANSGGDVVAGQLINALTFNKGFILPPQAMLCETANDPAAILKVANIADKAAKFAALITGNANR